MVCLDDCLRSLRPGGGETLVPKALLDEPLEGWVLSQMYMPREGSLRSYRKGRWHAHDMGDHYLVHMDLFDPRRHPLRHLAVDAPEVAAAGAVFAGVAALGYIHCKRKRLREQWR
jgi:hypothetical protein